MRRKKKSHKSIFAHIEAVYRRYLEWSLKYRWFVLVALLGILVSSAFQGGRLFQKFTLFPAEGLEGLSVRVELKRNTPIAETRKRIMELNGKLEAVSEGSFDSIYATIGEVRTGGGSGSRQNASHLGMVTVVFTTAQDFLAKEKRVVSAMRQVARSFSEETGIKTSITISRPGPPVGKPIQFQITSRDFSKGALVAEEIKKTALAIKGVHSIETDLDGDSLKYRMLIDNDLAVLKEWILEP